MTERSHFWGGTSTGDAALAGGYGAPYSDDMFTDIYSYILTKDRLYEGVYMSNRSGYSGMLAATYTNSAVTIATGIAVVDGKIYSNDAPVVINFPGNATYYVVLRKLWATQTIRLAIVTSITRTEPVQWEIPLYEFVRAANVVTRVRDQRRFIGPPAKKILDTSYLYWQYYEDSPQMYPTMPKSGASNNRIVYNVPRDYNGGLKIVMPAWSYAGTGNVSLNISIELRLFLSVSPWEALVTYDISDMVVPFTAGVRRSVVLFDEAVTPFAPVYDPMTARGEGGCIVLSVIRDGLNPLDTNSQPLQFFPPIAYCD